MRYQPILMALLFSATSTSVSADTPPAYRQVASEYGLPAEVLYAVALTESGKSLPNHLMRPWPWTLCVQGQAHFYRDRQAAFHALQRYLGQGIRNIDIGPMQVNWGYHRSLLRDPWLALEPMYNLRVGAWLLVKHWQASGQLGLAVGHYHAPGVPKRAAAYRQRVARWLSKVAMR